MEIAAVTELEAEEAEEEAAAKEKEGMVETVEKAGAAGAGTLSSTAAAALVSSLPPPFAAAPPPPAKRAKSIAGLGEGARRDVASDDPMTEMALGAAGGGRGNDRAAVSEIRSRIFFEASPSTAAAAAAAARSFLCCLNRSATRFFGKLAGWAR